jgi:nitrogen regulatory protein PII
MKKIEAIIQPFKLDDVKDALKLAGIDGVTIFEVRGHGRQKGHTETYRNQEYKVEFIPKIKMEIIVSDANLDRVTGILSEAARTGKIGDGKVFISTIDDVIRIRNGDRGNEAL